MQPRRKALACHPATRPCPRCSRKRATARHSSANGISAFYRTTARSRAVTIDSSVSSAALQTIEGYARSKEPFLLSLHFTAPHWPWEGPDDEAESKRIKNLMHRDGGTQ